MFARIPGYDRVKDFRRLPDAERLAALQAASEDIFRRHACKEISAEQATEELRKLSLAASNGLLSFFGL